jgi:RNA polymerase sigma-70 factor, ECF subfamily
MADHAGLFEVFHRNKHGVATRPSDAALSGVFQVARSAWPGVELDPAVFWEHWIKVLPEPFQETLLATTALTDLYLATACAHANEHAVKALDQMVNAHLSEWIQPVTRDPALLGDVRSRLWAHLLPAPWGTHGKIAEFAGRGPLLGWLRVVALRVALDVLRDRKPWHSLDSIASLSADTPDPVREMWKRRSAPAVKNALKDALALLDAHDRRMLRMYHLQGADAEALAKLYGVDRSTVFRRLRRMEEALIAQCRTRLKETLDLESHELDSLLDTLRSELAISLPALLA